MTDQSLLKDYLDRNSQPAFAEISRRYIKLVYATAFRELQDSELAGDVTQAVFLLLVRKANVLRARSDLAGWLFHAARLASCNVRRQERRRKAAEQRVVEAMQEAPISQYDPWDEIDPRLNDALERLRPAELEAVLLRFFSDYTLKETGERLGISEDGARKRIDRALEKIRHYLTRSGTTVTAAGLGTLLGDRGARATPETTVAAATSMGAAVRAGHVSQAVAGSRIYQLSKGVMQTMFLAKVKAIAIAISVTLFVIGGGEYAVRSLTQQSTKTIAIAQLTRIVPTVKAIHTTFWSQTNVQNPPPLPKIEEDWYNRGRWRKTSPANHGGDRIILTGSQGLEYYHFNPAAGKVTKAQESAVQLVPTTWQAVFKIYFPSDQRPAPRRIGVEALNGSATNKIEADLPGAGERMIFWIDPKTDRPVRAEMQDWDYKRKAWHTDGILTVEFDVSVLDSVFDPQTLAKPGGSD